MRGTSRSSSTTKECPVAWRVSRGSSKIVLAGSTTTVGRNSSHAGRNLPRRYARTGSNLTNVNVLRLRGTTLEVFPTQLVSLQGRDNGVTGANVDVASRPGPREVPSSPWTGFAFGKRGVGPGADLFVGRSDQHLERAALCYRKRDGYTRARARARSISYFFFFRESSR